jgi:hypothetical protein
MKTGKNIDSLFKKEKNTTETPLLGENELASILGGKSGIPFKNEKTKGSVMKISMIVASVVLAGVASGIILMNNSDNNFLKTKINNSQTTKTVPVKTQNGNVPYRTDVKGDLSAIKFVELTTDELQEFGIQLTEEGIVYNSIFKSQKDVNALLKKIGPDGIIETSKTGVFSTGMRFFPNEKAALKKVLFSPKMISDDLGMRRMTWYDDEDIAPDLSKKWEEEREKMKRGKPYSQKLIDKYINLISRMAEEKFSTTNNLIPILIRTGKPISDEDKKIGHWRPDCIFWYDATPEFIAALPERFKNQIAIEQKAVEVLALKNETTNDKTAQIPSPQQVLKEVQKELNVESQEVIIPEKEKRETGDSYFDVWRSTSGAIITSQLFPNPVRDQQATVKFVLKEDRNVVVTLHDIYGRRIAELTKGAAFKSGEHVQEILLKDVKPGIYLVAIQTDRGEQAVQRVIVE